MHIRYLAEDDEGEYEVETTIPHKYEVCPGCAGSGTELYGSLKGAAFSAEDFAEDPDFEESYFGGHYDVACSCCRGQRVVEAPDPRTPEERKHAELYLAHKQREEDYERHRRLERDAELRFGC